MLKREKRGVACAVGAALLLIWPLPFPLPVYSVTAAAPSAPQSELDNLIKRIETRYGRMRGLAADFEQTYSAPGVRTRRESGRLFLQRPRRMRWEYDPKPGKLFIV